MATKPPPPEDYDDNPEWTEEDWARARPASEVLPPEVVALLTRTPGRPALAPEARKQKINIRLSPDVLAALRASGPGWQSRVNEILRVRLGARHLHRITATLPPRLNASTSLSTNSKTLNRRMQWPN